MYYCVVRLTMVSVACYCYFVIGLAYGSNKGLKTGVVLRLSPNEMKLEVSEQSIVNVDLSEKLKEPAVIQFTYQVDGGPTTTTENPPLVKPLPNLTISTNTSHTSITLIGQRPGQLILGVNSSAPEFKSLNDVFIRATVIHSHALSIFDAVVGWIYFAVWTISFYPQIILNWRRKSVVGLSFDFIGYNIVGYIAYGLYNVGMYWIPEIKEEYKLSDPHGVNPVQLNDVFFTLHAVFIMVIITIQCCIYDRGGQKLSKTCIVLLCISVVFAVITLFLAVGDLITWLRYFMYFSYIKLFVTLIKYTPQAYLNFRRKSTMGWSIWGVVTDLTGGVFSLLQMLLIAYNSDDWKSLFGDPTKFGLGLIAIVYNLIFITQHFILYRNKHPYEILNEKNIVIS